VDDASASTGTFTENITGLTAGSGYSYVAFASNSVGTAYTSPVSTFTLNVSGVVITTTGLANWTVNKSGYSQKVVASGGTGAKTFRVTGGALPAGLRLNSATGAITGTPTATGTFNFTITATDTVGASGQHSYAVTINPRLAISTTRLANWTVNTNYSQTVVASGGTGAKTFRVAGGALPTGLSLNSATGAITGTPTATGTFFFIITGTDTVGASAQHFYAVTINRRVVMRTAVMPANWRVNVPNFRGRVVASGGTGAKTFSVTSGALPPGLILNSTTGVIRGTPTATGTYLFTIAATDTVGARDQHSYTVTINP